MRRKVLLAGLMFLMISAAAVLASADTKTDYDRSINFNRYHTFAWKMDKDSDGIVENSLVLSRIQEAATRQLNYRGMSESDENPDLYLVPHVSAREVQDYQYLPGPGWGWGGGPGWGWGAGWGWGYNDVVVFNYVEGTIILDMVDASTGQLVWRSISTKDGDNLISVQKAKKVDKMMHEAFEHFPRWPFLER